MAGNERRTLLTGATGYVGGRLMRMLEARGEPIRCMARRPEELRARVAPTTEVIRGDVLDEPSIRTALEDVGTAYYLVHSMDSRGSFADADRRAATSFGRAARAAGVRRIVYLGGLGRQEDLSDHLASRQEVGRLLRESGVPTIELRASIVIGSGSLSFEMIRALVEKLPVMVTPRWVRCLAQPIGIEDVVDYLAEAAEVPLDGSHVFEIGGADRASYVDIMQEYARQRGLRRLIVPVPVLSPGVSSLWLGLVTPLQARVGRKLIDSLKHDTIVEDPAALDAFAVRPRGLRESIARALGDEDRRFAETRWSEVVAHARGPGAPPADPGTRIVDTRSIRIPVPPGAAFAPIRRIGGRRGWYSGDGLWRLRGLVDQLAGGPGLRRGRRDPDDLRPGDAVDFWRVEAFEPDRLLRLAAEMRVPGRVWLQFEVAPDEGGSRIRQTTVFDPLGLIGRLYWYGLLPLHDVVFGGMLRGIARAAVYRDGSVRRTTSLGGDAARR